MKHLFCIIILIFPFICSGQKEQNPGKKVFFNDDLKISKLEDNMWVVETADMTTMYIVEGKDKAILIDTGTKCNDLDKIVRKITHKPLYIVVTHYHPDHAGNIRYFKEIYMHPADTVLFDKFLSDTKYEGRINFVTDGCVFDLGGGTKIEVKHMPGHTPGSIVLLDWKSGNCYSGDAFGSGQVWLQCEPVSPIFTYLESVMRMEKYMDQGIDKIYCGHYPYVKDAYDKNYLLKMQQLAETLIDSSGLERAKPYSVNVSIGTASPMCLTDQDGHVMIVYDPDKIK